MENLNGTERVMVISPHPDDVDFGCSGTIASWSRMGVDITYVICTSGDKGADLPMAPESIAAIREKEQVAAAEIVGVRKVIFLRLKDGELENNREFRKMLVRVLRQYRPDVVLSWIPPIFVSKTFTWATPTIGQPPWLYLMPSIRLRGIGIFSPSSWKRS